MNLYHSLIAIIIGTSATLIHAQGVYTPPPAPAPAAAQPAAPGYQDPGYTGGQKQDSKSLFGNELPFANPSDETITFNGYTWSLGNNRIMAARFEKYLNEPEDQSEAAVAYRKVIAELLTLLSPKEMTPNTLKQAVALLSLAAQYPGDAGISEKLVQDIFSARLARRGQVGRKEAITELEEEAKRITRGMSVIYQTTDLKDSASGQGGSGGGRRGEGRERGNRRDGGGSRGGMGGSSRTTDPAYIAYGKRLAEIEGLKKKYEGEAAMSLAESKLIYQASLAQMFVQRRFEHVVIGCRLYNYLFQDGDGKLKVNRRSAAAKAFGDISGFPPTVSTLDSLASEAIRDSDRHIASITYMLNEGEVITAGKRLSEAFMLGEFLTPVTTFPRDQKRKIHEVLQLSYRLLNSIDSKDYTGAREIIADIKSRAKDFDAAKAETAIAAFTRASDLHLMNAKTAMMRGEEAKAQEEIKSAIAIWPLNPKLEELNTTMMASNELVIAQQDFERHLAEKNFRQIYREQYRFAPIVAGDPVKEDAFKQIITNITTIDVAIKKAESLSNLGSDYAAWEELKLLRDNPTYSEDPELGKAIEAILPRVSDLTLALDKARKAEDKHETGTALAWYAEAKHLFPNSVIAKAGFDRIINQLNNDDETSR